MENDNSDATQIMDRVVENETITTETPTKPKRAPSTARNEHLAKARSARTEAYAKQKLALEKLKKLEEKGFDINELINREPVVEQIQSEASKQSEPEVVIKKKSKKKPKKKVVYYTESESDRTKKNQDIPNQDITYQNEISGIDDN